MAAATDDNALQYHSRRMRRIVRLFRLEPASGALMLTAIGLALIAANSPAAAYYRLLHHANLHFRIGALILEGPLVFWINEGLMVFFFLLVGLEIKRQSIEGPLARPKSAALSVFAAIGGMAVPALIYILLNLQDAIAIRGWAIPMATDIVLALGILSLLGDRIPANLRIFLTAFAIFDDIGSVIVIGAFYGGEIDIALLLVSCLVTTGLFLMNRFDIRRLRYYGMIGFALWALMLESGLTASLAGIVIAFSIPMRPSGDALSSPLRELERRLHPWVILAIIPVFAFFNSGISMETLPAHALAGGAVSGIVLGLFLGKQIGIFAATWLAVRSGLAELPEGISWIQIYGVAVLGGIGFTMSLFVASLAFGGGTIAAPAKFAILAASGASAIIGFAVLYFSSSRRHST